MANLSSDRSPWQHFDQLRDSYYRTWFRFNPEVAVELGVAGFDDRLTPYDDDEFGALIALQEKLLAGLEEVDFEALDPDRQLDFRLLSGQASIEHHNLLERDWRRRDPVRFLPVNAIYQLTVRAVENPADALFARLDAVPDYLRGARSHLQQIPELIPALWLEAAHEEALSGAQFLRGLPHILGPQIGAHRQARLHDLLETAARSLEDFSRFLAQDLARYADGDYGCGRRHFDRLLARRHFLPVDADELHRFGQRLFKETRGELNELLKTTGNGGTYQDMVTRMRADHPEPQELLACYREQMEAARRFVKQHDLVTLPETEKLKVVETPLFLRHQIPFAAYLEPSPSDASQQGWYYVTPADTQELLGEHNFPGLMHTCVHEAWPGHHLQFVTANLNPAARSLPRLINTSATLYEGWALYCEQLMQEQAFLDGVEHRFLLLRDRLWRALRVMLDVELHTRGLTVDDAARRMQQELGFPRAQAMADLHWYTRSPTVPMGYATGWALINAARDCVRETEAEFSLRRFHDRLLSVGSMALSLGLQRVFEPAIWAQARQRVFGNNKEDLL
ncbi:MAG: DUF885 domain-containing protein [Gammaproteobacteria bacterium]